MFGVQEEYLGPGCSDPQETQVSLLPCSSSPPLHFTILSFKPLHVLLGASEHQLLEHGGRPRVVRYRVEDMVGVARGARARVGGDLATCCRGLTKGATRRAEVVALVWPYMLAISTTYLVTLALFPGIESEVVSCSLGEWMPIILLTTFHTMDLLGKVASNSIMATSSCKQDSRDQFWL